MDDLPRGKRLPQWGIITEGLGKTTLMQYHVTTPPSNLSTAGEENYPQLHDTHALFSNNYQQQL